MFLLSKTRTFLAEMTDYSRLDETTLRKMLDASSDLDERQQLRSILRRLKKHSNTISFSPTNRENIMNKNHNNALPLMARWEQTSSHLKSSSSPNPNEILPRHSTALEKNVLSPIVNCNEVLDNSTDVNCNGKTDRSVFQVINKNFSRGQDNGTADLNRSWSIMSEGNIHKPVDISKQTLGKTLSEPISMDLPKLTRSRLIIQQMLAPRMAAAVKQENAQETTQLTTTFAPRVAAIATRGNVQETNTTFAPQVGATTNQGNAQETTPPTTTLSVQDDHSKSSDTSNSREAAPSYVDNDKPMFTRTLCDISDATLGETVVLDCKVVARLRPMVLWYRNSQLIPVHSQRYAQSYDADLARLTIRSVGYDIVGVYECAARNAFGKVTTACQLQLKGDAERQNYSSLSGQMATPPTPKVTMRRSETLPTSTMAMRIINSAARRKMEAEKSSLREDPVKRIEAVEVVSHPEEVEEEAVARSTRTEKASDGGKVTTTTTVTTHKTKDGAHLVTKQTKQITRVGGVGTTNYSINKCSAAPRLALSFNEADMASKYGDAGLTPLQRSATTVKQRLLEWCRVTLKDYKNISISNFSTSWNDGMAFCALVHHFIPDAFDYSQLEPKNRRENFQLAFETAEKRAGIVPLLDVEDMVGMTVPDWKCVFMYVQSIYREFVLPKPLQQRSANNAA